VSLHYSITYSKYEITSDTDIGFESYVVSYCIIWLLTPLAMDCRDVFSIINS